MTYCLPAVINVRIEIEANPDSKEQKDSKKRKELDKQDVDEKRRLVYFKYSFNTLNSPKQLQKQLKKHYLMMT